MTPPEFVHDARTREDGKGRASVECAQGLRGSFRAAMLSAGILPYRHHHGMLQVMLVHPGGPLWKNKDEGAWSIAKGEVGDGEDPLAAARRELGEETGFSGDGPFLELGEIRQKSGKRVQAWAAEADFDVRALVSNTFEMEWPPRSGRRQSFPEVDRAEYFQLDLAVRKINPAQVPLLRALTRHLAAATE
jgi:predicted NUDIX family NTP pyrophosphohydrolase